MPAAPKKRAAPKKAQLAEQFPKDTILTDMLKKEWRLGDVIGQGGFGLVYLASTKDSPATSASAQYVIKIEPGSNGPLFCEMNFYIRAAKRDFIQEFVKSHKLRYLAVPPYIGSGMHSHNSSSFRFLVMPRCGTDLQKLLRTGGGTFPSATTFAIGLRMVDALEYLHEREYVHADVKASNILLGFDGSSDIQDQVYLADYGLAFRYTASGVHKDYKVDPKNAHNGSIEFTSRDAHRGVCPSRRGDLEILGFCLLQWLCGQLPWETDLTNPSFVAQSKEQYMMDISSLIHDCLPDATSASADCIRQFLQAVVELGYQDEPDYAKFKAILKSGLTKAGQKDEWRITFASESKAKKRKSASSPATPKKSKAANGKGKASPARPRATKTPSPTKKKGRPTKKTTTVAASQRDQLPKISPSAGVKKKVVAAATRKSPLSAAGSSSKRKPVKPSSSKPVKTLQIPPPTKSLPKKSPASSKPKVATSAVRRIRKLPVSRNDVSIQTTPTLKDNK